MSSADHIETVVKTVDSKSAAARSWIAASWRRSLVTHGLDPSQPRAQQPIANAELQQRRESVDRFLAVAAPGLNQLFSLVGNSGCAVLLTDADGVVLDHRCCDADAVTFRELGLWQGADWSEAVEGTNGIGTCLSENRPVIVHRDQHFHARNTGMSCIDVPIHDPDGQLIAALDVSSARADHTEATNELIAAMIQHTARQIEADYFRTAFPKARIVFAGGGCVDAAMLFAIDKDDIVIGATRGARKAFDLALSGPLQPRPASYFFADGEPSPGFDGAARTVVVQALARTGGNVSEAARSLGIGRATLYRRMKRLGIG